ncbi:hypothetical protein F4778DRAFT_714011 [Xylariomycetidae sp. FL2044]|nr:hypothetical protein F4778DRAFT_714011 [Xylariomycetidae sp. FL2044]
MPFLRRRGVMASETDMRRHSTLIHDDHSTPPSRSRPDALLTPDRADNTNNTSNNKNRNKNSNKNTTDAASRKGELADIGEGSRMPTNMVAAGRASEDPHRRPESPPIQDETPKHRRFSMLRFRNASDSQLSTRMKQQQQQQLQAEHPPPMPQPPAIITTAPTMDSNPLSKKPSRIKVPMRIRRSTDVPRGPTDVMPRLKISGARKDKSQPAMSERDSSSIRKQTLTFDDSRRPNTSTSTSSPPADVDEHGLPLPPSANRLSESSRSEASISEHRPPKNGLSSSNSFFRLPRRKHKQPESLFPLGHLPQRSKTPGLTASAAAPRQSTSTASVNLSSDTPRPSTGRDRATPLASPTHGIGKVVGSPATALFRPSSRNSGQSSPTRAHLSLRGRSSTMSSLGEGSVDGHQLSGTGRTSSSTGRKSFGDLLGLSRMRPNADTIRQGNLTPATPGSNTSKNNSLQLTREPVVLPERREDESPGKYLARIEESIPRGAIASAISKGADSFSAAVLRSYMRSFSFFEEPMDMALRKLLMEAELPKETQQIDRCLQAFANRYHECNPGIYSTPDQAYFIAFSLLILHTDVFNKNNKYKMQKSDYLKNTKGEGIYDDVLECFYDNISYTPFIHVEDEDLHAGSERGGSLRLRRKAIFANGTPEPLRKSRDPVDPYTLILDGKLDTLRPPLKDQIPLEEHYSYLGTANRLNLNELQKTFFKTGVLQIVSARSRPDAFMTEKTANNPQEAHPGIVDIKVTKVGTIWRKDSKKKKTRSPWQEWGAILTGAKLYLFRNTAWVKNLMHQYEAHVKSGQDGVPLIFKPPLEQFKPDEVLSTDGAVALWDTTYKKHKNAFVYVEGKNPEEVILAQSDEDRNDWLAKLNYAAAFRTSGVRMRGVVGGNYEGQSRRAIRRLDTGDATQLIMTPTGEVAINRGRIDRQMARDILVARREIMQQKIEEAEERLQAAQTHLDTQLRNARHLLVLAPIQDKTRDQVRGGAAKIIAQLKWTRMEIWRLKCHRDILSLDLYEEKEVNGNLEDLRPGSGSNAESPILNHKGSRSSNKTQQQSPRSPAALAQSQSSESVTQEEGGSPDTDVFQTPPTSATAPTFREIPPLKFEHHGTRKASVSSAASSSKPAVARVSTPSRLVTGPPLGRNSDDIDEQAEEARERQVLEQAGLLDVEPARSLEQRPNSSNKAVEESDDRGNKLRRSLQKTLRDSAGHLSHHRSRKGKDSASSGGMSDETAREDVLTRGTGSFTVHGKKASVVNFGSELHNISTDERIKYRNQGHQGDENGVGSPTCADDDFHSVLGEAAERGKRRGSGASASTATARSFRELHRKYSSSRAQRTAAMGSLTVPSDEDSDAALSFSDGRHTPLPPLDDEDEGVPTNGPSQARFYTPDPPGTPAEQKKPEEEGADDKSAHGIERLPSPIVQAVHA